MMFYNVKNWKRFQHYSDRNPPWIKLHFEILSSMDWVTLDDASRVLAIACMLIASRNEGRVPADPNYMRRVAYLNKAPNFKPLLDCGFLEILLADASAMQANASGVYQNARPETETETEEEVREKTGTKKGTRFDLETLPPDWEEFCKLEKPQRDAQKIFVVFRDYWLSKAGKDAVKLDWYRTWCNWIRKELDYENTGRNGGTRGQGNIVERANAATRRAAEAGGFGFTSGPTSEATAGSDLEPAVPKPENLR